MPADPFYSSKPWRALRRQALIRDGFVCQWCKASVLGKGKSRVDHIRPRKQAPTLALVLSNLRTLCPACDNRRHAEKGFDGSRVPIGVDGVPVDGSWGERWTPPQRKG